MTETSNENPHKVSKSTPVKTIFKVIEKLLTVTLIPLVLAVIGIRSQATLVKINQKSANSRLYTELISRREESESDLRKDMFKTIINDFFNPPGGLKGGKEIEHKLLKLELLALNFGESLSLGPLFKDLERRIRSDASYNDNKYFELDRAKHMARLESLARRVADRQLASVASAGKPFKIVFYKNDAKHDVYNWPRDYSKKQLKGLPPDEAQGIQPPLTKCVELEGIAHRIDLTFSNPRRKFKTVNVDLFVSSEQPLDPEDPECKKGLLCDEKSKCDTEQTDSKPIRFTLDYFNFPKIDNSLLPGDQRIALTLNSFLENGWITVTGTVFPGSYASHKDRPTLEYARKSLNREVE